MKINPERILFITIPTVVLSVVGISLINNKYAWIPIVVMLVSMLFYGIFGKFNNNW